MYPCTFNFPPQCPDLYSFWFWWFVQPQLMGTGRHRWRWGTDKADCGPAISYSVGLCLEFLSSTQLLISMKFMRIKSPAKLLVLYQLSLMAGGYKLALWWGEDKQGGSAATPTLGKARSAPQSQARQAAQTAEPDLSGWGSTAQQPRCCMASRLLPLTPHLTTLHISSSPGCAQWPPALPEKPQPPPALTPNASTSSAVVQHSI